MPPVFINGKFCAQRMTGVQRYAWSLLCALDARGVYRACGVILEAAGLILVLLLVGRRLTWVLRAPGVG